MKGEALSPPAWMPLLWSVATVLVGRFSELCSCADGRGANWPDGSSIGSNVALQRKTLDVPMGIAQPVNRSGIPMKELRIQELARSMILV